ncbi:hypothetical protein BGX33_005538 [Mortierella sp. NVP41]|nr:hypothetical protein BGX33_005538 [Mortierella sp. NVP41]
MVAIDILTEDITVSSSSSSLRSKEFYTPYPSHSHSHSHSHSLQQQQPHQPLLSSSSTTHEHRPDHQLPSLSRSSSSSSSSSSLSSSSSPTTATRPPPQQQQPQPSLLSFLSGCIYDGIELFYNRTTAWLFPNEPEPLDLPSTIFFVAQVPFLFWVFLTWIPSFVVWLVGWKVSLAGDRGKGQGMRKTWSLRLALSLSFLKVYLRHADKLTIEECQGRSRSIPFMTAPARIRIQKVKIPAFPFRNRAESIVYQHLTEQERSWLHWNRKEEDETRSTRATSQGESGESGEPLSVKVQREMDKGLDSIQTGGSDRKKKRNRTTKARGVDQFAEGLDAEWLEYVGPDETDEDRAEMTSENMAAVLYFHGGGYYTGSKEEHRVLIGPLVRRLGKHVRILTINYRLAPQYPFPAALVDALSCYMWLLDQSVSETFGLSPSPSQQQRPTDNFQPRQVVFMGDSAGGGLALSLSLLLRDHASPSIPQPVKIVTWSPWLDLTQALPSFKENALTDCIPYEEFTHMHSDAVDNMFRYMEFPEEEEDHRSHQHQYGDQEGKVEIRQRAQVYCPDTCLRMKYVSPLYETDFRGIPDVLIVCGSAERFANECILMASRLEEQQQTCRIDIHEDMPHIFPLFRFHPSAMTALDRTSTYIREAVSTPSSSSYTHNDNNRGRNRSGSVVIPISPSSPSSSVSSSVSSSPSPSPKPADILRDDSAVLFDANECFQEDNGNNNKARLYGVRRVGSSSSVSSFESSSTSSTQQRRRQSQGQQGQLAGHSTFDPHSIQYGETPEEGSKMPNKKTRTAVNVIDLSGASVMSYHKQTRFGTPSDRDRALMEEGEEVVGLLDDGTGGGRMRRRRRKRERLTLQDVVTDATLYEWEVLLKQGPDSALAIAIGLNSRASLCTTDASTDKIVLEPAVNPTAEPSNITTIAAVSDVIVLTQETQFPELYYAYPRVRRYKISNVAAYDNGMIMLDRLNHPNILSLLGGFEFGGQLCLAIELRKQANDSQKCGLAGAEEIMALEIALSRQAPLRDIMAMLRARNAAASSSSSTTNSDNDDGEGDDGCHHRGTVVGDNEEKEIGTLDNNDSDYTQG